VTSVSEGKVRNIISHKCMVRPYGVDTLFFSNGVKIVKIGQH